MPDDRLQFVRVGASELSLWILALDGLALAVALAASRDGARLPLVAVACAAMAAVFAVQPLLRLPGAIDETEATLRALGDDGGGGMQQPRPAPFSLSDYARGVALGQARVDLDLPFRSIGGTTLRLDRYSPQDGGTGRPALVVVHGGAWRGGAKGSASGLPTAADHYFATRGYVVYDIDYRLAPAFRHPAALQDVECALGWVRQHASEDGVDPERVALLGRSAGGHLALLAAYRAARDPVPAGCERPAAVRAVVSLYGPTDLRRGYVDPLRPDLIDSRGVLRDFLGGAPDAFPDRYADATPASWIAGSIPATLLVHGGADQLVRVDDSRDLAARLRASGHRVGLLELPWSGHGFDAVFQGLGGQLSLYALERFLASELRR
ncbi:MAG: alpha/beta hydrolase [Chloroflexota bacterium]|nr:alpha/beta hydrolase [Chloroflexota bacterium]